MATKVVGGVAVAEGAAFTRRGGAISGNRGPSGTRADTWNVFGPGRISLGSPSPSSSRPTSPPPRQSEGGLSIAEDTPSSGGSKPSGSFGSSGSSVDFVFTSHLNVYLQGWHPNAVALAIPFQLGLQIELPAVTLDLLGEASAGVGYPNVFEFHLGGMAELYLFDTFGFGAGAGFYGNALN
ncbi:MAG: hypothetical protein LBG22_05925, partial [Treponema sp.]|nr:hypothetical protein [Treponema sp.]